MPEALPREPAIRPVQKVGTASTAGVVLTLRPAATILRLCAPLDHAPFVAALAAAGLSLPEDPCISEQWGDATAFWVAPGEWWLVDIGATLTETTIRADLPARPRAIVDLSHSRTIMRIGGSQAVDLVAKGCPLDLDPTAFPTGGCPQSVLAGVNLLLHRLPANAGFDLYVPRSYARHLWEWLQLAGAEYRISVAAG